MGDISVPDRVLLVLAAFSRHEAALDWAAARATESWGPAALVSPRFEFQETDYYEPTMGPGIRKGFWAFEQLIDPGELPALKLATNAWEAQYAALGGHDEPRPLNLDPGYITAAKLVLASTKDHAHWVYLSEGIFGEVTLFYKDRHWQHRDWTFPDYRRDDYQQFFTQCREYLRQLQSPGAAPMMWLVAAAAVPSLVVSWAVAWLMRRLAPRWGLVDRPGAHKVHAAPTPYGGGVAIWAGVVGPLAVAQVVLWLWSAAQQRGAGEAFINLSWLGPWGERITEFVEPHLSGLAQQRRTCGSCWRPARC